jgi:hypothetical protein
MRGAAIPIALLILPVAHFLPVVGAGGLLAPLDGVSFFVPAYLSTERIWDPYLFSGFPAFADPQQMTWYPPAAVLSRIPGSFNLFALSGYWLAALFAYLYVRRLTGSRLAGLVSGLTYSTSAFLVGHVQHPNMVHTAAWLPAGLWCIERMRERVGARSVALAALVLGLAVLAGHPQILAFAVAIALAYAVVFRPAGAGIRRWAAGLGLAGVLGVALAAVLVVPLAELLPHGYREELAPRDFFGYALPAREIARVWFPFLYGDAGEPYEGRWPPVATTGYVGFVPLFLGVHAMLRRGRDPYVRFWVIVAAVGVLLALGGATPLGQLAYRVPVLNQFRAPGRHLFEYGFALSVLAGIGIAAGDRVRPRALAGVSAILALLLAVAWVTRPASDPDGWREFFLRGGVVLSILWWAAAAGAWLVSMRWRTLGPALLGGVLLLDSGSWSLLQKWRDDPPTAATFATPDSARIYGERLRASGQRFAPLSGVVGPPETLPPNRSRMWRVPSTGGYNPLRLRRFGELTTLGRRSGIDPAELAFHPLPLDLLAVRYLTVGAGDARTAARLEDAGEWTRVAPLGGGVLYERTTPFPRAWLVPWVERRAPEEILEAIRSGRLPGGTRFDPRAVALVEAEVEGLPEAAALPPGASATVTRIEPRRIDVRTSASGAALLVLSDVHYPGWEVRCDGVPAALVRCDYALMGTVVPAGEHEVSFRFRPASLRLGAVISALVALGLIVAVLGGSRLAR